MKYYLSKKHGEFIQGHTSNYMIVKTKDKITENDLCNIKITTIKDGELIGNVTQT